MKKIFLYFTISSLIFVLGLFLAIKPSQAQTATCSLTSPSEINASVGPTTITISGVGDSSQVQNIRGWARLGPIGSLTPLDCTSVQNLGGGNVSAVCDVSVFGRVPEIYTIYFDVVYQNGNTRCQTQQIPIVNRYAGTPCSFYINPNPPQGAEPYTVTVTNLPDSTQADLYIDTTGAAFWLFAPSDHPLVEGKTYTQDPRSVNTHVYFQVIDYNISSLPLCTTDFVVGQTPAPEPLPSGSTELGTTQICNFVSDGGQRSQCNECFARPGVWTPFGCIETNPQTFVEKILRISIGIAGGIAFLMIIYGAFVTMTSAGNPEKLTEGREIITSAIAGLLLIIFSVVILKIIGVDILGIPGLG